MAQETAEEELKSPRISWANAGPESGDAFQYSENLADGVTNSLSAQQINSHANGSDQDDMAANAQQDDLAVAQNGGLVSQDHTDDGDLDVEESDLDDDMMDKISSSPSIDDGGSFCQLPSFDSARQDASPGSSPASPCFSEEGSSSPYLDRPVYLPLQRSTSNRISRSSVESPIHHHHLPGALPEDLDQTDDEATKQDLGKGVDQGEQGDCKHRPNGSDCARTMFEEIQEGTGPDQQAESKAPVDAVENSSDIADNSYDEDDLIFPYEGSTDEDDDDLFLQSTIPDPRFVDSGWGGECLHDAEDIDFELVYALHTFIATVEGQANATKGDAMVLLDDSNSYWWLVRVVKDSSIGKTIPIPAILSRTLMVTRLLAGRAH